MCVRVWRMEEGVCVHGGWKRVCVCMEDGRGMGNRGKEEREERYDDGGKIAFI